MVHSWLLRARLHADSPSIFSSHWSHCRRRHPYLGHPLPRFDFVQGNPGLQRCRYDSSHSYRYWQRLRGPVQSLSWWILVHQVSSFSSPFFGALLTALPLQNHPGCHPLQPSSAHSSHELGLIRDPLPRHWRRTSLHQSSRPLPRCVPFLLRLITKLTQYLPQGTNTIATEFHYQPADPSNALAQDLLTQYLSTKGPVRSLGGSKCATPDACCRSDCPRCPWRRFVLALRLPGGGSLSH